MSMILQGVMIFMAQYLTVLLLGFQSKLMRDNRWGLSFFTSWGITLSQTATVWAIANNPLGMPLLITLSGFGGACGIVSAHFVYDWYDKWRNKHVFNLIGGSKRR